MNENIKRILWISPYVPYDCVRHAGGKIENFYLKGISQSGLFDIYLLSLYQHYEKKDLDLDKYGIKNNLIETDTNLFKKLLRKIMNIESTLNPFHRYAGFLQNYMEKNLKKLIITYASEMPAPDIIILQWTETVLLSKYIKKLFPNSKIISIEEDVSFLKYQRKANGAKSWVNSIILCHKYNKLKKIELNALKLADSIWCNNPKDARLLFDHGIGKEKINIWSPYFENYSFKPYICQNKDIIFYGAMNRIENYQSAIWFIENVFPYITDDECRFLVIGNRPPKQLKKYNSNRIKIVGFVEDVSEYFSKSLCLVAPLQLGAGIKIKVLEALSSGIPVLTNHIGIEGIPASDSKEYFLCESAKQYIETIHQLLNEPDLGRNLSKYSRKFIKDNYDKEKSLQIFIEKTSVL